jgi:hypothetical protein
MWICIDQLRCFEEVHTTTAPIQPQNAHRERERQPQRESPRAVEKKPEVTTKRNERPIVGGKRCGSNDQGAAPATIVPRHMPRPNVCARRCPRDALGKYGSREESLIAS